MRCPTCVANKQESFVYPGMSRTTCAYYQPFYDKEGKYHHHDGNTTTTDFSCSNGHQWIDNQNGKCWCGWPNKESIK